MWILHQLRRDRVFLSCGINLNITFHIFYSPAQIETARAQILSCFLTEIPKYGMWRKLLLSWQRKFTVSRPAAFVNTCFFLFSISFFVPHKLMRFADIQLLFNLIFYLYTSRHKWKEPDEQMSRKDKRMATK